MGVIKKRYLMLFAVPLILAFSFDISISPETAEGLLRTSLICIETKNSKSFDAESILKLSCIAFAWEGDCIPYSPEDAEIVTDIISSKPASAPLDKAVSIPSYGIEMRNQTSYVPDTAGLLKESLTYLPVEIDSPSPQVLIFHTHTTESFAGEDRTDDESKNVVAIGNVIAEYLTERGINTLHCKTVHDYDYNLSYSKSFNTVQTLLSENPSIKVVLDVHRDGITYEDGSGLRVTADINGETVAQYMLVLGTDEGGLSHPGWQKNLSLGLKLQEGMNKKYPGLARPLNLRQERFNQSLSSGMLIVECGGNSNSIEEVKKGALLFSEVLYSVITKEQG